jgi:hypothetical protein
MRNYLVVGILCSMILFSVGGIALQGCATTGKPVFDANAIAQGFADGVVKVLSDPNGPLAKQLAKDLAKYPEFAPAIAFAMTMNWNDPKQVTMLTEMITIAALETQLGDKPRKELRLK